MIESLHVCVFFFVVDVHNGLGGNPARVGFNGGNGTGFWELSPFSKDTRLAQIDERSNVDWTGRYIFRIDEVIQPAGCVEGVYRTCHSTTTSTLHPSPYLDAQ